MKRVWVVLLILVGSAVRGLQGALATAAIAVVTLSLIHI